MSDTHLVPYQDRYDPGDRPEVAARAFFDRMRRRRSVRQFAPTPVSRETVEWIVRTAAWAPSGANQQPWRFVCIADREVRRSIRRAAEEEERRFYRERASKRWLRDLEPLGTGETKEFLEAAPWLVAVFRLARGDDGSQVYYPSESVGIALGFLVAAAHHAGLSTLVYTPQPMGFLGTILKRPPNERPYALVPLGYPAEGCRVPVKALSRKPFEEVALFVEPESP